MLVMWLMIFIGASYVYVLFFVNLTGYALGLKGTTALARHVFLEDWAPGLQTLLCTAVFLFSAVQVPSISTYIYIYYKDILQIYIYIMIYTLYMDVIRSFEI